MPATDLYTPNCIYTYGGRLVNVTNMKKEDVFAEDIAFGLARECRFGNHTKKFYSVADHSIWCMRTADHLYPDDTALQFRLLMHDAHEAYLGDWVTPLVDAIDGLYPGVKEAITVTKRLVQRAIDDRFGLTVSPLDCLKVKEIDRMALEWEWEHKVKKWAGFLPESDDMSAALWLHYFKKLVKVPVVISSVAA